MFKSALDLLSSLSPQTPILTPSIPPPQAKPNSNFVVCLIEDLPCKPSTAIKAVGYKFQEQELYIQWLKTNKTNCYFRVPIEIWAEILACTGSLGSLYHKKIKGKYGSVTKENIA